MNDLQKYLENHGTAQEFHVGHVLLGGGLP